MTIRRRFCTGRKNRRARSHHDGALPPLDFAPFVAPLPGRQPAVQHGDRLSVAPEEAVGHLWSEHDFGHQHDDAAALAANFVNQAEIAQRFSTARDAVQQRHAGLLGVAQAGKRVHGQALLLCEPDGRLPGRGQALVLIGGVHLFAQRDLNQAAPLKGGHHRPRHPGHIAQLGDRHLPALAAAPARVHACRAAPSGARGSR